MGISVDTLTALGLWMTFCFSVVWMAVVGEAVGPLVLRLWRARRARQEEEARRAREQEEQPLQPVVQQEGEPAWMGALRASIMNMESAIAENTRILQDLRELQLIASEAAVETLDFQQTTELHRRQASSSN